MTSNEQICQMIDSYVRGRNAERNRKILKRRFIDGITLEALAVGQAQALANQNECCCSTKMLIAETGSNLAAQVARNNYEAAMMDALEDYMETVTNPNKKREVERFMEKMGR